MLSELEEIRRKKDKYYTSVEKVSKAYGALRDQLLFGQSKRSIYCQLGLNAKYKEIEPSRAFHPFLKPKDK